MQAWTRNRSIEVRDLSKVYGEEPYAVHALKGVSLTIHRGEFLAIMGPSGSGKSTFMHLLGCLDHPTAGSHRLAGQEVSACRATSSQWCAGGRSASSSRVSISSRARARWRTSSCPCCMPGSAVRRVRNVLGRSWNR